MFIRMEALGVIDLLGFELKKQNSHWRTKGDEEKELHSLIQVESITRLKAMLKKQVQGSMSWNICAVFYKPHCIQKLTPSLFSYANVQWTFYATYHSRAGAKFENIQVSLCSAVNQSNQSSEQKRGKSASRCFNRLTLVTAASQLPHSQCVNAVTSRSLRLHQMCVMF